MARRIDIRFLDKERTRAEVTVTVTPSWLARLGGARGLVQTCIARYRSGHGSDNKPYDAYPAGTWTGWTFEIDNTGLPSDVADALQEHRKWDTHVVEPLPEARAVRSDS